MSPTLSPRQRDVLRLVADGATARQAAERLGISPRTAQHVLEACRDKAGPDRTIAAVWRLRRELEEG